MSMISYYTKIDIETCKRILDIRIKSESISWYGLKGSVNFNSNKFELCNKRSGYNDRTRVTSKTFYGELIEKENGTIIQGEFRVPTELFIFIAILAIIVIIMFFNYLFDIIFGTDSDSGKSLIGLIGASIVLGFEALKIKLMDNGKDENHILYIISSILNATFIQ